MGAPGTRRAAPAAPDLCAPAALSLRGGSCLSERKPSPLATARGGDARETPVRAAVPAPRACCDAAEGREAGCAGGATPVASGARRGGLQDPATPDGDCVRMCAYIIT